MTLAATRPLPSPARSASRFEALVRTQTPRLWQLARSLAGDRDSAALLIQRGFAALEPRLAELHDRASADWLRRRVTRAALDLHHERAAKAAAPEAAPELAMPRQRYREGLRSLPRGDRDAVLLCDGLGFEPRDAADLLGLTLAALRERLHRGRIALCEQLRLQG